MNRGRSGVARRAKLWFPVTGGTARLIFPGVHPRP